MIIFIIINIYNSLEHSVRNGSTSSFGHNRILEVCTKLKYRKTVSKVKKQDITWKAHKGGKNHDSPQAVNSTTMERNTQSRKRRGNDLSSSSSPHSAAVTQRRQRPLSFSLSLSRSVTLCTRN